MPPITPRKVYTLNHLLLYLDEKNNKLGMQIIPDSSGKCKPIVYGSLKAIYQELLLRSQGDLAFTTPMYAVTVDTFKANKEVMEKAMAEKSSWDDKLDVFKLLKPVAFGTHKTGQVSLPTKDEALYMLNLKAAEEGADEDKVAILRRSIEENTTACASCGCDCLVPTALQDVRMAEACAEIPASRKHCAYCSADIAHSVLLLQSFTQNIDICNELSKIRTALDAGAYNNSEVNKALIAAITKFVDLSAANKKAAEATVPEDKPWLN